MVRYSAHLTDFTAIMYVIRREFMWFERLILLLLILLPLILLTSPLLVLWPTVLQFYRSTTWVLFTEFAHANTRTGCKLTDLWVEKKLFEITNYSIIYFYYWRRHVDIPLAISELWESQHCNYNHIHQFYFTWINK